MRELNEDYFGSWKKRLFVVADGLGGYAAGEIASRLAVEEVIGRVKSKSRLNKQALKNAFRSANLLILKEAAANPQYFGMATTLVSLLICSDRLVFASLGDSLAFLLRDRKLKRVTKVDRDEFGFLTQAIGLERPLSINTESLKAKRGDLILLATDGLTDSVSENSIQVSLESQARIGDKASLLIKLALKKGGPDNITVCIIKLR